MHDDYLWDGTGEVDPDVAALERVLMPLRYETEPLVVSSVRAPSSGSTRSRWLAWAVPAAAMAAAAVLVATLGGGEDAPAAEAPSQVPAVAEPASVLETPPQIEPAPAVNVEAEPELRYDPASAHLPGFDPPAPDDGAQPPGHPTSSPKASRDDARPAKLTSSEVRDGIAPLKEKALACGRTHGAPENTKVKMKLAIAGATGRVTSAKPQAPWADTPLGRCVADVLKTARFPRFTKRSLGVLYPIRVSASAEAPAQLPPQKVLRASAMAVSARVRACGVAHDVKSGTRVELALTIDADGTATAVDVEAKGPISGDAVRCVRTSIGALKFGTSASGVSGRLPVRF
ncbi:MAG: hypothetical protein AAGA54_19070 [Myxococcota bacterium]